MTRPNLWLSALLIPALSALGCFEDPIAKADELGDGDSETGDGDPGDGDGDPGDGDGDPGDGDGDPGDGDGDGDPGDGDGDGDGDPVEPACADGTVSPGELCLSDTPNETAVNQSALRLAVGEFDEGSMGVVVVGGTSSVSILRGDGNGALFDGDLVAIAGPARSIAAGDIDTDGDIDFVTDGEPISVRRNDGNGGWEPLVEVESGLSFDSFRLVLGQIDGNAPLDVVYAEGYNTRWIRGDTWNGWSAGTTGSEQFTGGDSWLALTEFGFDGDGFTDLLVASRWSAQVTFARGMGNGTFVEQGQVNVCNQGACDIHELHAVDVTGDDDPDIIASFASGFSVIPAKGDGTFDSFALHASPGADHIASGDIDNDGDNDLVVASRTDGDLRLFLNDGTGEFADPIVFAVPGESTRTVAMADMNGDGAMELLTAYDYNGGGWVAVFEATP